ncbi:MAG: hypothetical protein JRI23_05030 [Deltaproteobacteria bacterium]|nr:hypothetical protein [Deltaproteobacteria bacterium]MBW2530914.1 hypothetical protein [Deltaproteobacteria bacterium]
MAAAALALLGCSDGSKGEVVIEEPPQLLAGAAMQDITPQFEPYTDENGNLRWDEGEPFDDLNGDDIHDSLWLGGFGPRQPTGVHDPLEARSVAIAVGEDRFTLTAVDALGLSRQRIRAIQNAVVAAADPAHGLRAERIIIASTHTLAGPDTIGIFGPDSLESAWDGAYLDLVANRTAESILDALDALEPASFVLAHADAGEGFVRDIDPPEITDPYVGIVQLRRDDGSAVATLTTAANHPEAAWSDNTEVSADYLGPLRTAIEAEYGGVALAFVGALGLMQSPAEIGEPGFDRVDALGALYADEVLAALAAAEPWPVEQVVPKIGYREITVPFQNGELYLGVSTGVVEGYSEFLYDDGSGTCSLGCFDAPVAVVQMGEATTIVTIPGELSPELVVGGVVSPEGYAGAYADAEAEPHLEPFIDTAHRFLIGLAFAELGYLYPKKTFEPDVHPGQLHGPGPEAASRLMARLCNFVQEVAHPPE